MVFISQDSNIITQNNLIFNQRRQLIKVQFTIPFLNRDNDSITYSTISDKMVSQTVKTLGDSNSSSSSISLKVPAIFRSVWHQ